MQSPGFCDRSDIRRAEGGRGGGMEGEWNLMKRCTKRHSFTFRHTVQLLLQQEDLLTHTALSSGF